MGNLNGDLRLIKTPKTECENTPVAGKIEVPGLEEGKLRIIVKSLSRLNPPPPAVGTMENPCLEELNIRSEVKSPKKLENPHPPQPPADVTKSIHSLEGKIIKNVVISTCKNGPPSPPPVIGTIGLPDLAESKLGIVVKRIKVNGPPSPPVVETNGLSDLEELKIMNVVKSTKVNGSSVKSVKNQKKSLNKDLKVKVKSVNFDESKKLLNIVSNLRTNGLSDSSDSWTKNIKCPPKSKLVDTTTFEKATNVYIQSDNIIDLNAKVNDNEIEKDMVAGVDKELNVVENVDLPLISPKKFKDMNHCSDIQSHLLSKHVEKTGLQIHNDKFLRGNLGRKLKTNGAKSTSNTPEKSEIAKMFEKIRLKNEKNRLLSGQKCNQNSSNLKGGQEIDPSENTIDASLVNLSSKLGQSPSLKPKNLSKFNAIRSVFENSDRPVNIENNIGH